MVEDSEAEPVVEATISVSVEEAATEAETAIRSEVASVEEAPAVGGSSAMEEIPAVVAEQAAGPSGMQGDDFREHLEEVDRSLLEPSEIHLRVSSRHLILASPYFKAALNGPWREAASTSADCSHSIYADDWDPEAFLILMHIIHGRNRQVPRRVSLELLAKIAVLVDYYECHETVELFAEIWLQELKSRLPEQLDRDLIFCLCISWVFGDAELFKSVTSIAVRQSQEPLATLGLPIPERIVGK